jgi:anti-sigma factor RsiW
MGDDRTPPDRGEPDGPSDMTEPTNPNATESFPDRLRQLIAATRARLPSKFRVRGGILTAAYGLLITMQMVGVASAQAGGGGGGGGGSVGSQLCGTAISKTINSLAPIVLAIVLIGGLMLAWMLHGYSGFKKDPQKVKDVKDWRNRAGTAAVTAPLLGKALEIIIGFIGLGLAGCIDIVPAI